jgi:hypothetical protein
MLMARDMRLALDPAIQTSDRHGPAESWLRVPATNLRQAPSHVLAWDWNLHIGLVSHQLIKNRLISPDRIKRGPFVVVFLGGAWVGVL